MSDETEAHVITEISIPLSDIYMSTYPSDTNQPHIHESPVSDVNSPQISYYESSFDSTEPASVESDEVEPYMVLTESEIYMYGTAVFLESGGECYQCQLDVASVILNRMTTGNMSLYDVLYAPNQFSVAKNIPYYSPSESTAKAVAEVLLNGPTLPEYVTYFRANHYHTWYGQVPYKQCENTYISYDQALYDELCDNT